MIFRLVEEALHDNDPAAAASTTGGGGVRHLGRARRVGSGLIEKVLAYACDGTYGLNADL
jgi:hypothetical protein